MNIAAGPPTQRAFFSKHPSLTNLILVFLSLILRLTVGEFILRRFMPVYTANIPAAFEYDPESGYRFRTEIHLFRTTDFQQETRINHLGTSNFQETFEGYSTLVFSVGDSYTVGDGLPADMAYPFQLDLILNRDPQGFYTKKFGIANLGVGGYGGEQSLIALRRATSRIGRPAIVIYLGSENDYQDDVEFQNGSRHQHIFAGSPYWGRLISPIQWLATDVQIVVRLKILIHNMRIAPVSERVANESSPVAELEQPIFEKLLAYCKQSNSSLIVSWSDVGPSYDFLKTRASKNGVGFADWRPRMNSIQATIPALPLKNQHSGGHYRGWVNRVIAE